jgi:hypothetical protein
MGAAGADINAVNDTFLKTAGNAASLPHVHAFAEMAGDLLVSEFWPYLACLLLGIS